MAREPAKWAEPAQMQMRVMLHLPAPGVEHADHAELRAEVARIIGDRLQCARRVREEQIVHQFRSRREGETQCLGHGERHQKI